MRTKILHVIDSLGRGGAETLLVGVIRSLVTYDHHIVLLSDKNDFKDLIPEDCTISIVPFNRMYDLPFACLQLKKLIHSFKPDIVHSHLFWSSIIARLATPSKVKLFYSNHCLQSLDAFQNRLYRLLEKALYNKRHTLISVSKTVEADYKNFIKVKGRHVVLHNFVDDRFFSLKKMIRSTSITLKCIAVGRLATQKNWAFLLAAFSKLKGEDISLDIYGTGELKEKLEAIKNEYELEKVQFKGLHRNIEQVLPHYDLFISGSLYEGHPVSVLEAMAAGIPLLLSDIPVMHEAAQEFAVYFDLADTQDFVEKIMFLKNNEPALLDVSSKGREFAGNNFRKEEYLRKLVNIYKNY